MKILLIGFPGSGRKTLVNELKKHYSVDFYDDFFDGEYDLESKAELRICPVKYTFISYFLYNHQN